MTDKPSLTLKRQMKASPARLFKAWTEPTKLVHWWGPADTEEGSIEAETDLRVGGAYRIRFRTADGRQHEASGLYEEIVPDQKLVMSWTWSGAAAPTRLTVTFRGEEGGTMLILTHAGLDDTESVALHEAGWSGAIDKLERFVTRGGRK